MSTRLPTIFVARFIPAMMVATSASSVSAQEKLDEELALLAETSTVPEQAADISVAADVADRQGESRVMDQIDLQRTEITGNQELPKVMYIVPWRASDPDDLPGPPVRSLLREAPAPLDPDEFARQVESFEVLYGTKE